MNMRKFLLLIGIFGAGLLSSCSIRGVEVPDNEDVQFVAQAEEEDAIAIANGIEDPGSPIVNRYGGFFVWKYQPKKDTVIECITITGDTVDADADRVYKDVTVIFDNCMGTDTIIRHSDTLMVEYRVNGQIIHRDADDGNPYVFSTQWGNPFEQEVSIYKRGTRIFKRLLTTQGEITSYQTGESSMHLNHIATYFAVNASGRGREFHVGKSVDVDFSKASEWHPGLPLTDSDTLNISFEGTGYFKKDRGTRFDIEVRTDPYIVVTGACRKPDGSLGILEGRIIKTISHASGEKTITITFRNCQATIEN